MAVCATVVGTLVLTGPASAYAAEGDTWSETPAQVAVAPEGSRDVTLDTTVFAPKDAGPHPALLLAHGFGGSKEDLVERARDYAADGYVVMTYTARGFGESGGFIHLNDPDFEIADARALIDVIAARPDVVLDADGDPRVGVAGGSYGGALALMTAATDPRVDVVVAAITWHDLAQSLFPQHAVAGEQPSTPAGLTPTTTPGPLKALWAATLFGSALRGSSGLEPDVADPADPSTAGPDDTAGPDETVDPDEPADPDVTESLDETGSPDEAAPRAAEVCGRFERALCREFLRATETGTPSAALLARLQAHGPAAFAGKITAPTMLVQGMADTLFGLEQADATARDLAGRGVPLAVRWIDGGHDGPSSTETADDAAGTTFLGHYLKASDPAAALAGLPVPGFVYPEPLPRRATVARLFSTAVYPGLTGDDAAQRTSVALRSPQDATTGPGAGQGAGQDTGSIGGLLNPPGGQPASVTAIPGAGAFGVGLPTYQLAALPGQSIAFDSAPLTQRLTVVGSPSILLTMASSAPEATFFVSLWQVQGQTATLPRRLVAPVRVTLGGGGFTDVRVTLPAATYVMEAGSTWRVLVTSTDSAYANSRVVRLDQISAAEGAFEVPVVTGTALAPLTAADPEGPRVAMGIAAVLLVILGSTLWRRRRAHAIVPKPEYAGIPLVVESLVKTYADGHRAVDDVSWRAEPGQVVGLLGPNGAGKTTTMRMVLGLIHPDSGSVHVLGQPVRPGAAVLHKVGALVEGPGFLPHLSGRDNLRSYWQATGADPDAARYDEVLEVAALGDAIDRPVRSYSHGMKQRLGIAQAMLGMPDVLILDEPTNGLDPPQIAAMRPILQDYAATGRTVVISSHMLAEVEMTCSHVVVMHAGRVITSGAVADLVGTGAPQGRAGSNGDRNHLEDVFLGIIAGAQGVLTGEPTDLSRHTNGDLENGADSDAEARTRTDRLRQVRSR